MSRNALIVDSTQFNRLVVYSENLRPTFIVLCLCRLPLPHVAEQDDQEDHSETMQSIGIGPLAIIPLPLRFADTIGESIGTENKI